MADANQASLFALEGVFNSQPLTASITGVQHVEGQKVFPQSKVVPELVQFACLGCWQIWIHQEKRVRTHIYILRKIASFN